MLNGGCESNDGHIFLVIMVGTVQIVFWVLTLCNVLGWY